MAEDVNRAWKDQYMLRFPHGLRDRIKATAEANNRSMNAEIIARLESTFPPETLSPDAQRVVEALLEEGSKPKGLYPGRSVEIELMLERAIETVLERMKERGSLFKPD